MAEISASMVMELRQRTGLGMMECKKALTEAGGDLAKAEELLRIKSGAKASKAAGRIAAEGVDRPVRRAGREDGGDGRGELRDRLRREERRLPRVRGRGRADRRRATIRPMSPRSARGRSLPARPSKRAARRSCRRSARTCRSAASRATSPRAGSRRTCTAAGSACWSTSTGGDDALGKDLAMHVAATQADRR